jgi:hypothetical protein
MDEIEKIHLKSAALVEARNYLLSQTPPDPTVVAAINADIVELIGRHLAAAYVPETPQLTVDKQRQLEQAAATLKESIDRKSPAPDILKHAKALFDLSPWPPQGFEVPLPGSKPKPAQTNGPRTKATIGKYYAVDTSEGKAGAAPNILFYIVPATSPPDEYSALQIDIERTLTVMKVLFFPKQRSKFDDYFSRLADLARAALGQDQARLGRLALLAFQSEVVARESGPVKNAYIRRLGGWALLFGAFATGAYLYCRYGYSSAVPELHRFREFFSMLAGCFLGTWLSFSIRRVQLTFDDLARLEQDLLDPSIRLLFVAGLTIVVGLLLATKAVVITIGGFNSAFLDSGTAAVLIGCLCGIGEMGLPTAIAQRASEFVAVLGGAKGTQTPAIPATSNAVPAAETHRETGAQQDHANKAREVNKTAASPSPTSTS